MQLKKMFCKVIVVASILVLVISTMTFAGAPQNVYYENSNKEVVKVDYAAAKAAALNGDSAMMNAFKANYAAAMNNFRNIYVEDTAGKVINYSNAVGAGTSYTDAIASQAYAAVKPTPTKELSQTGSEVAAGTNPSESPLEVLSIE